MKTTRIGIIFTLAAMTACVGNLAPNLESSGPQIRAQLGLSLQATAYAGPIGPACGGWKRILGAVPKLIPAFPDLASRYDTFAFDANTGDFDALLVRGRFPYARYFSFNLYDFRPGNSLKALADIEIPALPGNLNPYLPGNDRNNPNRNFEVYLLREGSTFQVPQGAPVIFVPAGIQLASLFTRVYRPDAGVDDLGGVGLPSVYVVKTGGGGSCPNVGLSLADMASKAPDLIFNQELIGMFDKARSLLGKNLDFFRADDSGLFPNAHNNYILTPLDDGWLHDDVAVVTLRPPTFENTYAGGGSFAGKTNVRYWSFCYGGLAITATMDCIVDDQVRRNRDGTATIIIGPSYLRDPVERAGLNFMEWKVTYKPGLLHRHMLAADNFAGAIRNVPKLPRPFPVGMTKQYFESQLAQNFMGEYAPRGRLMSKTEFGLWLLFRPK